LCKKFTRQFGSPLSAYPLMTLNRLRVEKPNILGHDVSKARYLCFADLLGGTGRNGPGGFTKEMATWVTPYREKLYAANGLEPPTHRKRGCNVVYTWKNGLHGFHPVANTAEVDKALRAWMTRHNGTYRSFDLAAVSMKEQLLSFQQANIHVTTAGSTAFSSYNLGPGSDLLYLSKSYEIPQLGNNQEITFQNLVMEGFHYMPPDHVVKMMDVIAARRGC